MNVEVSTVVVNLIEKGLTLATAESCTGGLLSASIVDIPGSSACFMAGIVSYSNEAKINILGVPKDIIRKHGAVSSECAMSMAENCAKAAGTDIGVSTTGIAGPGGGTPEKPVGLVYIGMYIEGRSFYKKCNFEGDRKSVREQTVLTAMRMLAEEIDKL